jgi:hypothetical protein
LEDDKEKKEKKEEKEDNPVLITNLEIESISGEELV